MLGLALRKMEASDVSHKASYGAKICRAGYVGPSGPGRVWLNDWAQLKRGQLRLLVKGGRYSLSFGNSSVGTAVPASASGIAGKPGSTNKDLTLLIALEFSC